MLQILHVNKAKIDQDSEKMEFNDKSNEHTEIRWKTKHDEATSTLTESDRPEVFQHTSEP